MGPNGISFASPRLCQESLDKTVCKKFEYMCSNMWRPDLNVIAP